MNRTDTGFKGQCLGCRHWHLWERCADGKRRVQEMAYLGFGECTVLIRGHYSTPGKECNTGKFVAVEQEQIDKRVSWLKKRG